MEAITIPARRFSRLKKRFEKRIRYRWQGKGWHHPKLLPQQHGNGKQAVAVSFYAAPEVSLVVLVDSSLPLELPLEERCQSSNSVRSFRDLTDWVKDIFVDYQMPIPRARLRELRREIKEYPRDCDDLNEWELAVRNGCTWCAY